MESRVKFKLRWQRYWLGHQPWNLFNKVVQQGTGCSHFGFKIGRCGKDQKISATSDSCSLDDVCYVAVNSFWCCRRCPSLNYISILVNKEFLEIPLG